MKKIAIFDQYVALFRKRYKMELYLQLGRPIGSRLSNGAIFSDLERPSTKISRSRHYLRLNISETVYDPTHGCHFEWSWLILSDSEIFNDTMHRAVYPRQLSFLTRCFPYIQLGQQKWTDQATAHYTARALRYVTIYRIGEEIWRP